jgi:cytochrome P450
MVSLDPPAHARLRGPAARAFTPRRVESMVPPLGKLEARLARQGLVARFPGLALVPDQQLTFHPNISFRGPQSLWATAT